jgi:GNAT superfamily N-acetyltransferase
VDTFLRIHVSEVLSLQTDAKAIVEVVLKLLKVIQNLETLPFMQFPTRFYEKNLNGAPKKDNMSNLIMKNLEDEEFAEAAHMYFRAFRVPEVSWTNDLPEFWKSLKQFKVGHFIVAKTTTIVGMGALFPYQSLTWIGHMAVEPSHQLRGIGTLLLKELLRIAQQKKISTVKLDATGMGEPLYKKYNFKKEGEVLQYQLQGTSTVKGVKITQEIPEWCLTLDNHSFGGDRRILLQYVLTMGGKMIIKDEEGYGILWKKRVGPIVAENVDAAVQIANYAYTMGAKIMDVPLHPVPIQFISQLKGKPIEYATPAVRMRYGDPVGNPEKVFASFSSAMG